MRLVNAQYSLKIPLQEHYIIDLILEKPSTMARIMAELQEQCMGEEGNFILSKKDKELKLEKMAECIVNPFAIDFNNRKILNRLYADLNLLAQDYPIEKATINTELIQVFEKAISGLKYGSITYHYEFDWISIFKAYDVRIDTEYCSLTEKLVEYIKILSNIGNIKILFLVNIHSYLEEEEIVQLCEMGMYQKVYLIFVESMEYTQYSDSKRYILDKDDCLILK